MKERGRQATLRLKHGVSGTMANGVATYCDDRLRYEHAYPSVDAVRKSFLARRCCERRNERRL